MFVHVVYFWLKEDATEQQRKQLVADCLEILKRIPTVRQIFAGRPANTPRAVVNNSYDVGLCVLFDNRAGQDVYQDHPLHHQFIQRNNAAWKRVQVYDFE